MHLLRITCCAATMLPLLLSRVALGEAGVLAEAGVPLPDLTDDAGTDIDWTVSTVRFPEGWNGRDYNRAFLTIKLDRPAPSRGFHVAFELEPRSATPGIDFRMFSPDVQYFEPGESEKIVAVEIHGDGEVECDEAVAVRTWLPNLTSKIRYGYVILVNDDWEGPAPAWRDGGSTEAGSALPVWVPSDGGPTDVPLIKDLGNAVRLACHDDPSYDPLAIPPPTLDGGVDSTPDIVYTPLPDAGAVLDGGASDTGSGGSPTGAVDAAATSGAADSATPGRTPDGARSDLAVTRPDGGGCDCSLTDTGRPQRMPGLFIAAILMGLLLRRARRR